MWLPAMNTLNEAGESLFDYGQRVANTLEAEICALAQKRLWPLLLSPLSAQLQGLFPLLRDI